MKTIRTFSWVGLALVIGFAFSVRAELWAGAATADITPSLQGHKIPLNGYGARHKKPATGVHDPISAKVLVLKSGDASAAIAVVDLVLVTPELRRAVLQRLEGTGIGDQNLLISATHTHSAPAAMQKNLIAHVAFGKYQKWLVEWTADQIATAIKQAQAGLQPAVLKAGSGRAPGLTLNRRDPAQSYNYDTRRFSAAYDPKNPANITDDEMIVLRLDNKAGKPIAVLVNFATHATVLGPDNLLISADWPGAMRRELEQAYPGATAIFMNGAEGDQAPAMPDNPDDFACVEIIGKNIAAAAKPLIENALPVNAEPLQTMIVRRQVPGGIEAEGIKLPSAVGKKWIPAFTFTGIRIGDVIFLGAPLEMVSEIGQTMKAGARGLGYSVPIVAGLANDYLLYCAVPDQFAQGGYEVGNTAHGKIEAGLVIGEEMMMAGKLRNSRQ
jgi:hypothetical protein